MSKTTCSVCTALTESDQLSPMMEIKIGEVTVSASVLVYGNDVLCPECLLASINLLARAMRKRILS